MSAQNSSSTVWINNYDQIQYEAHSFRRQVISLLANLWRGALENIEFFHLFDIDSCNVNFSVWNLTMKI